MDRFLIDDVGGEYDAVEPMRAGSFDMSFTLSTSGDGSLRDPRNPLHQAELSRLDRGSRVAQQARRHASSNARHGVANTAEDEEEDSPRTDRDRGISHASAASAAAQKPRRTTLLHDQGRLNAEARHVDAITGEMAAVKLKVSSRSQGAATIAEKLEEKAQEAMLMAGLLHKVSWKLSKRTQDVRVYRPTQIREEDADKVIFRVSCEVKASMHTIMEYLAPRETKSYFDIESQVFPGLLHASVIKKIELPPSSRRRRRASQPPDDLAASGIDDDEKENASPRTQTSAQDDGSPMTQFPRLQVKWHASRFAGRFVKPVDFFFVEYANMDELPDGRKRGYVYMRSVESFKGDELATRLNSEQVSIPHSVSKCKRAVIGKAVYMVTPVGSSATSSGSYEVTLMMVLDFQEQFSSAVGQRIICNFTDRLTGIRELLYKTLFHPVNIIERSNWKDSTATRCVLCKAQFSLVKPRHHCRSCGEAVCGQCSRKWAMQPGAQKVQHTRLCTSCSLQARSFLRPDAPTSSPRRLLSASQMTLSSSSDDAAPTSDSQLLSSSMHRPAAARAPRTAHDAFHSDVCVASVISTETDPVAAVRAAFSSLVLELRDQTPHFMYVSYSPSHSGELIYSALADVAADTLFIGGTSCGGLFNQIGAVDNGPALGLWGIYDPEGSYAVLNGDLATESPRDAARRCLLEGMQMLCLETEESPDFIWMHLATGSEEVVMNAVNEVADCSFSVVAGASYSGRGATQICSEGAAVGCVTSHGICFAVCCPSVEVSQAFFTCYEPKEKAFVVTKALGRTIQTLDHKPAFLTLNDGCHGMLHEFVSEPERFDLARTKLPVYYPLARARHDSRTSRLSRFQVLQALRSSSDASLAMGGEVRTGEKLRVMSVAVETVEERLLLGLREALQSSLPVVDAACVAGCLLSVSSNYPLILREQLQGFSRATAKAFRHGGVLGSVSAGQQGVLLGTNEAIHANAMITALVITTRKKAIKLNPLRPIMLRRYSTY
ncbi:hypothetical protein P43SY_009637 [Pythium insidiosum]|uniref:FYVE-type domain-containing protein n=1 Tax=Pythium insidiosum TaxID=114742 RepID=A0AAD5Q802_PYTIN|nr:hypothetical protein P43SY_009637 [Pythium insidiosum]